MGFYSKGGTQGLFEGLGIRKWTWKKTPVGHVCTFSGLSLLAADLAKFGLLMLNKGTFNERQLVAGFYSILKGTAFGSEGCFLRRWLLGQRLVIVPSGKMVAVRLHRQNAEGGEEENSRSNFMEFLQLIESLVHSAP